MISKEYIEKIEQYKKLKKEITNYIESNLDMGHTWWDVQNVEIVDEAFGELQGNGEYCDETSWGEDWHSGNCYYPTEDGRYLKIPYEC